MGLDHAGQGEGGCQLSAQHLLTVFPSDWFSSSRPLLSHFSSFSLAVDCFLHFELLERRKQLYIHCYYAYVPLMFLQHNLETNRSVTPIYIIHL